MELDYFITGSRVDQSFVKDKWLDSSSAAIRGFNSSKKYTLTGISGSSDFSIFFTLDKKNGSAGSFLYNKATGENAGFFIGYDSNNTLFVKTFDENVFAHSFNEIRLGQKNCIGIVKNKKSLSLYKYNLTGTGISQKESILFPVTSNPDGQNYYLGSGSEIFSRHNLAGFSGLFDQMVCFNKALTEDQCLSIFSGFQPLTRSFSPVNSLQYFSSGYQIPKSNTTSNGTIQALIGIANGLDDVIPTGGNYLASFTGYAQYATNFWQANGSYALSDNLCTTTGSVNSSFITGSWVPSSSVDITFADSIQSSYNSSGERVISHFFSFTSPLNLTEHFFTYNIYQKYSTSLTGSWTRDNSYLGNFVMSGIATNFSSGITILANVPSEKYNEIGYLGTYDRIQGKFSVSGLTSGNRVFWGNSGVFSGSGYILSGKYIDLLDVEEDNTYPLIYDLSNNNVNLLHATLSNYATGTFYQDTSIVFTGINSWSTLIRAPKGTFWETVGYHLSHNKAKVVPQNTSSVYLNSKDYWQ